MTLRSGVEGSLTPCAPTAAGTNSATAIKAKRCMRYLPISNVRVAITVPSRLLHGSLGSYRRGTATSLPSLQTPWAAVPLGRVPGAKFRIAVGREASVVWVFLVVVVVTMLVLVRLALSLTPCAKEGGTKRATNVSAIKPLRMIKHLNEKLAGMSQVFVQKQAPWDGLKRLLQA
ncbi:hypothetical protein XH98_37110 [Bradyrhizobium sp. CCBAU 51745]|nr:hypothetical protein [Bradyrhizobium sp. CCBAU 51745]